MDKSPLLPVPGFSVSGVACGIKKNGGRDMIVIAAERPATMAGCFTQNTVVAAPVTLSREIAHKGSCRAIVANAGNANACTGAQGMDDARAMAHRCADALGLPADQVAVASTGVIGQQLPMDRVIAGINAAATSLAADGWEAAADAIRTTDLVPKWHSVRAEIGGRTITVTGIGKGSGMIHPNMATMLGFVCTDAPVGPEALHSALSRAVEKSFNRITVDGDTSTNDCVLCLAGGAAGGEPIAPDTLEWAQLADLLEQVCVSLAKQIVADGEGATKLVTLTVEGLETEADAVTIARQVATSSLVKTALFGCDPNWGRILAAAGQTGIGFDPERFSLAFDDRVLVKDGTWQGAQAEAAVAELMQGETYTVTLTLGAGPGSATVWTCDLSYDYVRINADYRT